MHQAKNRIEIILDELDVQGINQTTIAKRIGFDPSAITRAKSGEREVSAKFAKAIAREFGYNYDWIVEGKGQPKSSIRNIIPTVREPKEINDDFLKLPVYMIAGAGSAVHIIETEPLEYVIINKRLLKPGIVPIKVRGDSMENTILNGAVVGVDTNCKDLAEGHIYCCYLPLFGALIRRIKWGDGGVLLLPDNSLKYEPKFFTFDEARENLIYGKVVWIFQAMP